MKKHIILLFLSLFTAIGIAQPSVSGTTKWPVIDGNNSWILDVTGLNTFLVATSAFAEAAQDNVGSILVDGNTINFTYSDPTPSITAEVITQMSITSDASGIKLSGDQASPGNDKMYGTDGSGVKGWHSLPAGSTTNLTFSGTSSPVTLNSSTGTDVTFTAGTNITFTGTGTDLTINSSGGGGGYATVQEEGSDLTQRTKINFVGSGITAADDAGNSRTNVTLDADLNSIASNSTNGFISHTAADTYTARSITAGNGASITNGDGVSGNPTIKGDILTDEAFDAKGDLIAGTGANTAAKLSVGTDGKQIYADASQSTGLRWGASVITPSQITSDQNDYNPTGWANCQIARISGDVEIRAITSFAATFSGDKKLLLNVGSYPLYIPGEHTSGTAANRVRTPSDYILYPDQSCEISYDNTFSRWVILTPRQSPANYNGAEFSFVAGSTTAADYGNIAFSSTGTGAGFGTSSSSTLPITQTGSTGTTSTGGACFFFSKTINEAFPIGESHVFTDAYVYLPTLSDATDTYTLYVTVENGAGGTSFSNNNCGIRYTHGTNSGKFQGYSRDATGTESTVDLGVTVAASTMYRLRVELNRALSEARFYVNGEMKGVVTGNMQTAQAGGSAVKIIKSAGTSARLIHVARLNAGYIFN